MSALMSWLPPSFHPSKLALASAALASIAAGACYHQIQTYFERRAAPHEIIAVTVPATPDGTEFKAQFHIDHRYHKSENLTILFEAGLGAGASNFSYLQAQLSEKYSTFSYDRLGLGWSSKRPKELPNDTVQICVELHALLNAAYVKRPLVIVGHSWGSPIARTYAHNHSPAVADLQYASMFPEEVAAIVNLDGTCEALMEAYPELRKAANLPAITEVVAKIFLHLGLVRMLKMTGLIHFIFGRTPGSACLMENPQVLDDLIMTQAWPQTLTATAREIRGIDPSFTYLKENCRNLGQRIPNLVGVSVVAKLITKLPLVDHNKMVQVHIDTQRELLESINSSGLATEQVFFVEDDANHFSVVAHETTLAAIEKAASYVARRIQQQANFTRLG